MSIILWLPFVIKNVRQLKNVPHAKNARDLLKNVTTQFYRNTKFQMNFILAMQNKEYAFYISVCKISKKTKNLFCIK